MEKKLSEISRQEWIVKRWIEITRFGDAERVFVDSGNRTPDEAAQAKINWDLTATERGF